MKLKAHNQLRFKRRVVKYTFLLALSMPLPLVAQTLLPTDATVHPLTYIQGQMNLLARDSAGAVELDPTNCPMLLRSHDADLPPSFYRPTSGYGGHEERPRAEYACDTDRDFAYSLRCDNPAQYLCNRANNSYYRDYSDTYQNYNSERFNAFTAARISCRNTAGCNPDDMNQLGQPLHQAAGKQAFINSVYTDERKESARRLYSETRRSLIAYLESAFPGNAQAFIDKIPTSLSFSNNSSFDQWKASFNPNSNKIELDAMILLVDSPNTMETLRGILLHEMSHAFDHCSHDHNSQPAPLTNLATCLNREDSVAARIEVPSSYHQSHPSLNPHCPWQGANPAPQVTEAFADYVSTETIAMRTANLSHTQKLDNLKKQVAQHCLRYNINEECNSSQSILRAGNNTTHPSYTDRINNIIFANPENYRTLGCPATSTIVSPSTPVSRRGGTKVHCEP